MMPLKPDPRRALLLLIVMVLVSVVDRPAQAQDTIQVRTYQDGALKTSADGAFVCPSNVPVGETAVAFSGEVTTTNEQGVTYGVQIAYLSGTNGGRLEHFGLVTNVGAWNVSVSGLETQLLLSALAFPGSPLQWAASLLAKEAGTVAYTFETRLNGNVTRTETCTFTVVEPNGVIFGQVAFTDPTGDVVGVNGLPVILLDQAGNILDDAITRTIVVNQNGDTVQGAFVFEDLEPGLYRVRLLNHDPWEPVDPPTGEQDVNVPPGGVASPGFGVSPGGGPGGPGGPGDPGGPGGGSVPAIDYGDLPSPFPNNMAVCPNAMGGRPCYQTLRADDGAAHAVRSDLSLGVRVDADSDGAPGPFASGDDVGDNEDDEDGVLYAFWPPAGGMASLTLSVRNASPFPAYYHLWIDLNHNGQLGDSPQEYVIAGNPVPPNVGIIISQATFPVPPFPAFFPYVRLRLTTDPSAAASMLPYGLYRDGEVEDYYWLPGSQEIGGDFGDAPDEPDPARPDLPAGYPTRFQDDGARHAFNALVYLGETIDPEGDGQPTAEADGDDGDLGLANDDDGIVFAAGFTATQAIPDPKSAGGVRFRYATTPGASATLVPLASTDGLLDAWFDWNRDGDWGDAGEQVFDSVPVRGDSSFTPLTFTVPASATLGYTFVRFRFSLNGDLDVTGLAPDGEVEDYLLQILQPQAVTTSADSGPGSLRQALTDANTVAGPYLVDLGGLGKQAATILLQSPLPAVSTPIILQGGGTILDGSEAGANASGLVLEADGSVVSGLAVQGFQGHGLVLEADGILIENSTITANAGDGIRVIGSGNTILASPVFGNGGLGIDLGGDGPTPNDADEIDGVQNAPVIATAVVSDSTRITGSLVSTPEATFRLDFFAGDTCNDAGQGEANLYLGTSTTTTDGDGQADFDVAFGPVPARGSIISATATGPDGSTSEFSSCLVSTDIEVEADTEVPEAFRLHGNYPNPFNPETVIRFEVPERRHTRLDVFDVLGRVVETLVDETLSPGTYRAVFKADDLPSGVYFYRLKAGAFTETRSMVLLR